MFNLIISLGIITYVLLITTIVFITVGRMKRVKRKKIFFKLHQIFSIAAAALATVHGTLAALYFYGII